MFSYLRSHHKRSGSTPSSPDIPLPPPRSAHDNAPLPSPGFFEHQQPWQHEEHALEDDWMEPEPMSYTPVSPLPPVLPPIPRVTSVRKGATSPTKRESFGINFDRTSFSLDTRSSGQRQDSALIPEEGPADVQTTWRYGQSAQSLIPPEPMQRTWTRGSDTLTAEPMQKQPSKASTTSLSSSARSHQAEPLAPTIGGPYRQEHRQYDEQQARMFQRMERPQMSSNRRPHTAGAPAAQRRRPESHAHTQNGYSPVTHHGLQPPAMGILQPMSAMLEDAPPLPSPAEQTSINRVTPVSPQPTVPQMSPGFLSVSYDRARSRTPPTKHDAPGRPGSPVHLPTVKSRSKINLRNPMSLLLRRRSGHNLEPLQLPDEEDLLMSLNNRSELPEDYDPRIKGTKVHDFNAPRPPPKRVYTSPLSGQDLSGDLAPSSTSKEERSQSPRHKRSHTPTAFVEHFDDDEHPTYEQGVRAEELANKAFVKRNSRELLGTDFTVTLPPFARKSPVPADDYDPADGPSPTQADENEISPSSVPTIRTPPVPLETAAPTPPPKDIGSIMPTPEDKLRVVKTHSPSGMPLQLSPPKPRVRSGLGLPKHLGSRSSRFSFQLGGPEAQLQEKILEERHKAKQAEKAMQAKIQSDVDDYIDEDDYDNGYDDADMYGEEPIPGMEDDDLMDGPLSSFSLAGSRAMSMTGHGDGFNPPEIFTTASQLPTSTAPPRLDTENPLGTIDVVAAARMALSSNPPSPADYSPASLDARSLRLPSNASGRPSVDRGRKSHEGSFRSRFESSHSGSRSRTREVLPATQEHPEGMAAQICEEDEEDGPYGTTAPVLEDLGDDMYFDDGMIEDPGDEEDVVHFNEEAFDDPSSQLYERRPINEPTPGAQNFVTAVMPTNGVAESQRASVDQVSEGTRVTSMQSNARPSSGVPAPFRNSARKSHMSDFNNLEAYHSALADAATQAAAEGRFSRKFSQGSVDKQVIDEKRISDASMDSEPPFWHAKLHSSGQSLVQEDARTSNESSFPSLGPRSSGDSIQLHGFPIANGIGGHARISSGLGFDPTTFSFEPHEPEDLEGCEDDDDAIIAAANAEALANDDDGEYGSEFGFYAAPPPMSNVPYNFRGGDNGSVSGSEDGSDLECVNGGYFGPKGLNTVERSKSLREPNLTPITERSEFSTRNSCISLLGLHSSGGPGITGLASASAGALPSPGLAQLARMSPYSTDHDEMSMENLMKLRRGAFGDGRGSMSDVSAAGSNSPRNASPVAQAGGYMLPRQTQLQYSSHANAVGWLNGVGIGIGSAEGLERLGEDDESSSDDGTGVTDGEIEGSDEGYAEHGAAADRMYDNTNSPMPDSPTIIAAHTHNMSPSFATGPSAGFSSVYQQRNQAFYNLSHITTATPHAPSPPPQQPAPDPQTPGVALYPSSPTTAHRTRNASVLSSSPSPMPRSQLKDHRPSIPHSPAHSRHSSRNEEGVSVAYVQERDEENGGQRWVLERRKTSDIGEVIIVGREVVTGGRI